MTAPMELGHTSQALDARCLSVEGGVSYLVPNSQERILHKPSKTRLPCGRGRLCSIRCRA